MENKIIYKELSYKVTGLLFKAHKDLGQYRNEKQYADYFEKLLQENNIIYSREHLHKDINHNEKSARSICDFIIENKIILEFKTKNFLNKEDYYQIKRYLSTLNLELGILVNFRQKSLVPKRILNIRK
jgi:GxxExxY protein